MRSSDQRIDGSFAEFEAAFPDDLACLRHLFDVRHGPGTRCGKCGKPATWRHLKQYVFRSDCCHFRLSPKADTFLNHIQISPRLCFYAVYLTAILDAKISQRSLARHLGIRRATCLRLADRIRTQMTLLGLAGRQTYSGKIYVDEMHVRLLADGSRPHIRGGIVFGITDGVHPSFFCVPDRKATTLSAIIQRVVTPGTTIVVDGHQSYRCLDNLGYRVSRVIHSRGQWKNQAGDYNSHIENCWRELRRRLERTHHYVDTKNLWTFLGQLEFILTCRKLDVSPFWSALAALPQFTRATLQAAREQIDLR